MEIVYSPKFIREQKRLPKNIIQKAERKEITFRKNIFDSSLRTHKLSGKFKDFWAFSVDNEYRIIFEIGKKDLIYFHSIGNHSIYSD